MSVPDDFTMPVSSFNKYGGHASIHVQYDAQSTSVYYRGDGNVPGNNIAYVQGKFASTYMTWALNIDGRLL